MVRTRLAGTLAWALLTGLAVPANAPAAKRSPRTASLRASVMGTPYGARAGRVAVPVLLSYGSARATHVRSLVGIVLVRRRRMLRFHGKLLLPDRLVFG